METKINQMFRNCVAVVFMALTNFFVYFGFANQYSSTTFNLQKFDQQYNSGIYQFRFLSSKAVLWLYEFLQDFNFDAVSLHFLQKDSDVRLYIALFLYNTFFAALTILMIGVFLNKQNIRKEIKIIFPLFLGLIIGLSQFVIVPYDTFTYFILCVFMCVIINYLSNKNTKLNLFILCVLVVIGTLNRETMALSLALAATLLLSERNIGKDSIFPLILLIAVFAITYIALRIVFHTNVAADGLLISQNFSDGKNILALIFILLMFLIPLMLSPTSEQRKLVLIFYFFSLPYTIFCLFVGILFEIRLFVPILILALLLSQSTLNRSSLR